MSMQVLLTSILLKNNNVNFTLAFCAIYTFILCFVLNIVNSIISTKNRSFTLCCIFHVIFQSFINFHFRYITAWLFNIVLFISLYIHFGNWLSFLFIFFCNFIHFYSLMLFIFLLSFWPFREFSARCRTLDGSTFIIFYHFNQISIMVH